MNKNAPNNGSLVKRLILHFNVDKTIVMKDSIGFNNTELYVIISLYIIYSIINIFKDKRIISSNVMGTCRRRKRWRKTI